MLAITSTVNTATYSLNIMIIRNYCHFFKHEYNIFFIRNPIFHRKGKHSNRRKHWIYRNVKELVGIVGFHFGRFLNHFFIIQYFLPINLNENEINTQGNIHRINSINLTFFIFITQQIISQVARRETTGVLVWCRPSLLVQTEFQYNRTNTMATEKRKFLKFTKIRSDGRGCSLRSSFTE